MKNLNPRNILTILVLLFTINSIYSQNNRVTITPFSKDSLYDCDTIKMEQNYFFGINKIESKGEYLMWKPNCWVQYGKWTYWDKKGNIILETDSPNDNLGIRYINQWLLNGKQILKNGNGYFYDIGMEYYIGNNRDSTVFEIHDGLKNGYFKVWFPAFNKKTYYLKKIGLFENNQEKGLQTTYYENGKIEMIYEFNNRSKNGYFQKFFDNGNLMENGKYINDSKQGNWKFWNEAGILVRDCNYKNSGLFGIYFKYHSNGKLKNKGFYTFQTGKIKIHEINPDTGETDLVIIDTNELSVKDGIWEYYDNNGKLIKTEKYIKGELNNVW